METISTTPQTSPKPSDRIAKILINALKGGVVPRVGLGYITVGRNQEIKALLSDVESVQNGGAAFRLIMGKYGAGKSFLLQTIRNYAMDKNIVVIDADLSPERRLTGSNNEGLATYKELMKNISTKTAPDGGALPTILNKWINSVRLETMTELSLTVNDFTLSSQIELRIHQALNDVQTIVNGFDFARIIILYWQGVDSNNDELKNNALKWLRGEYQNRSEAKRDLGVNAVISNADWYEYVKLFALFAVKAGYAGMLMQIDEIANISKVSNSITRQNNYEKILAIYNDVMQGKTRYLGVLMGGTPDSIEDTRRGLFSYAALRSRLENSRFTDLTRVDLLSPIIRIQQLTGEEMFVLTGLLENLHAQVYEYESKLTNDDRKFFIETEYGRMGAAQLMTPRELIRDFIEALNIIYQNPDMTMRTILSGSNFNTRVSEDEILQDVFKGYEI